MKLYKVSTKSLTAFVVATNPTDAEKCFTGWLNDEDYGYSSERVINRIDLLADTDGRPGSMINPTGLLLGAIQGTE